MMAYWFLESIFIKFQFACANYSHISIVAWAALLPLLGLHTSIQYKPSGPFSSSLEGCVLLFSLSYLKVERQELEASNTFIRRMRLITPQEDNS